VKNHYDSLAKFVIEHEEYKDLWWSDEFGWTSDPREADIFSVQELVDHVDQVTEMISLPSDGTWCKVQ
jgi:hypothetical protein